MASPATPTGAVGRSGVLSCSLGILGTRSPLSLYPGPSVATTCKTWPVLSYVTCLDVIDGVLSGGLHALVEESQFVLPREHTHPVHSAPVSYYSTA